MLEIGLFEGCLALFVLFQSPDTPGCTSLLQQVFPKGLLRRIDSGRNFGGLGL
jgi:hypothetical protein